MIIRLAKQKDTCRAALLGMASQGVCVEDLPIELQQSAYIGMSNMIGDLHYQVIVAEDVAAGVVGVMIGELDTGNESVISARGLYILTQYRNAGVAKDMINFGVNQARLMGCDKIRFMTGPEEKSYYSRMGAKIVQQEWELELKQNEQHKAA